MTTVTRAIPVSAEKDELVITRFDIHQILQHILMMGSFLLLAFTGLPQKFSNWEISQWWIGVWGGIDNVRTVHHFAAYVMVFDCVYHLLYFFYNTFVLKRPLPLGMIPTPKDVRDLILDVRHLLGFGKEDPKFGRFNYREKFDYWAIFWGMPIIALSGFVLMFPVFVTRFLPGEVIPIALVAHSDEALLAVAWIFIVHFYFSHLAPSIFPLNTSIFTGRVPLKRYQEEHPLEYERMASEAKAQGQEAVLAAYSSQSHPAEKDDRQSPSQEIALAEEDCLKEERSENEAKGP